MLFEAFKHDVRNSTRLAHLIAIGGLSSHERGEFRVVGFHLHDSHEFFFEHRVIRSLCDLLHDWSMDSLNLMQMLIGNELVKEAYHFGIRCYITR